MTFRNLMLMLACAVAVGGCGSAKEDQLTRTLTERQAAERVDEHIHAAIGALQPRPALKPILDSTMECDDPTDHGPAGRVTVEHQYQLDGIEPSEAPAALDALAAYWTGNGYRVLRDERGKRLAEIAVESTDGFAVVVTTNTVGRLSIIGSSPCVWPTGSPPA